MSRRNGAAERRKNLCKEYWPDQIVWTGSKTEDGEEELGWCPMPRTFPLILALLSSKEISKNKDPSKVYLELWSRHLGEGLIEMGHEADHAYAAGYYGSRAVRTWQERMQILEDVGFICTVKVGNQKYRYVGLVHPTVAVQKLRDASKIDDPWWHAYLARKAETKEATYQEVVSR